MSKIQALGFWYSFCNSTEQTIFSRKVNLQVFLIVTFISDLLLGILSASFNFPLKKNY